MLFSVAHTKADTSGPCCQAPLLAYTHFVEALFVMNGCRAGLAGSAAGAVAAAEGADALSLLSAPDSGNARMRGATSAARGHRETIYR